MSIMLIGCLTGIPNFYGAEIIAIDATADGQPVIIGHDPKRPAPFPVTESEPNYGVSYLNDGKTNDVPFIGPVNENVNKVRQITNDELVVSPSDYESVVENPKQKAVKELVFKLREISMLREAARKAGGDIKIKVTLIGIQDIDILLPLIEQGYFDMTDIDPRKVQIASPTLDKVIAEKQEEMEVMVAQRQKEVDTLEQRRNVLLEQIGSLEKIEKSLRPPKSEGKKMSAEKAEPVREYIVSVPQADANQKSPEITLSPIYYKGGR